MREAKKEGIAAGGRSGCVAGASDVTSGGGGAVRSKETSSARRIAGAALAGRIITRSSALRASSGARIAPVETAVYESLTPTSSSESFVESCAPLASSEAYQATRTRASEAFETARSRPPASYQRPPSTAKDWCSQAVELPREVSMAPREPSSETTRTAPAWARQPYGVSPGSSKSPFVSATKNVGIASGVGTDTGALGAGAVGGGAVRSRRTLSARSTAGASLAGRSMTRSCALRALPGARIGPVETAV